MRRNTEALEEMSLGNEFGGKLANLGLKLSDLDLWKR